MEELEPEYSLLNSLPSEFRGVNFHRLYLETLLLRRKT